VPGDAEITFKEWVVSTLGQRARDPVEAADGSTWWAGQWGNLIGRIDTATGEITEYPLLNNSMPHTVEMAIELPLLACKCRTSGPQHEGWEAEQGPQPQRRYSYKK
jgi:hypothetical protein